MPQYLITLVHGTFARRAAWTQPGSPLRRILHSELDSEALFSVFEWSGLNSHSARLRAAKDLRTFMLFLFSKYPSHRHVIIAHSHGGNVVSYALRDPRIRTGLYALITMGTPFLKCRRRDVVTSTRFLRYAFPSIFLFLILSLAVGFLIFVTDFLFPTGHPAQVPILVITLLGMVVVCIGAWKGLRDAIRTNVRKWAERKQDEVMSRLDLPDLTGVRMFCGVVPGDEAQLLLGTAAGTAGVLPWVFTRAVLLTKLVLWGMLVAAIVAVGVDYADGWRSDLLFQILKDGLLASAILASAALVAQLAQVIIVPALRSHPAAFGWEPLLDNFLVDIRTTMHPPCADKQPVQVFRVDSATKDTWKHSAIPNDPNFAIAASRWLLGVPCGHHLTSSKVGAVRRRLWILWCIPVLIALAFRLPTYKEMIRESKISPSWQMRYPALVGHVVNDIVLARGRYKGDPKRFDSKVPSSNNCRLEGYIWAPYGTLADIAIYTNESLQLRREDTSYVPLDLAVPNSAHVTLYTQSDRPVHVDAHLVCWDVVPDRNTPK